MEKISERAKFSLKLLVDEKRNKVVLAEACRDFVDVLCSLLTLPMGTIVRLLKKHQKSQEVTVGCFNNLYQSVSDMLVDDFETEACKNMLLYPRSSEEIHCRRLKLNIDDTEATKFFTCPCLHKESCRQYSNFNTTMCSCGKLMSKQVQVPEEEQTGGSIRNGEDGVFVTCRSSYIVTDDLKVRLSSLGIIADVLCGLGYESCDNLQEILVDVGFEEVMTLLGNLFVSEFPLTSTFLKKPFMPRGKKRLSSTHEVKMEHVKGGLASNVKLYVRKSDMKILCAECNEDFIDSLLLFLVLPLELAWSLSNVSTTSLSCVGNLCLSECRGAIAPKSWKIPYYYSCSKQILDVPRMPLVVHECLYHPPLVTLSVIPPPITAKLTPRNPKIKSGNSSACGSGFVKRNAKFFVSDDLVITPMRSSSTIGLFKKSNINVKDLEEQEISISKAELIGILSASLISRSALTNGLSNLLAKKLKK